MYLKLIVPTYTNLNKEQHPSVNFYFKIIVESFAKY